MSPAMLPRNAILREWIEIPFPLGAPSSPIGTVRIPFPLTCAQFEALTNNLAAWFAIMRDGLVVDEPVSSPHTGTQK